MDINGLVNQSNDVLQVLDVVLDRPISWTAPDTIFGTVGSV